MSEAGGGAVDRRPSSLLALLLNALLLPAGYVYVGAWRWALAAIVLVVVLSMSADLSSVMWPPGVHGRISGIPVSVLVGLIVLGGFGSHAVLLSRRRLRRLTIWPALALTVFAWVTTQGLVNVSRQFLPGATYWVSSSAMQPTLDTFDAIMSSGSARGCSAVDFEPGDIVIWKQDGVARVLRVIAAPGQTVEVTAGALLINGRPVDRTPARPVRFFNSPADATVWTETLPNGRRYRAADFGESHPRDDMPAVRLPEGRWFLMGDNRDDARDSRVMGPAPGRAICGVPLAVVHARDDRRVGMRLRP